MASTSFAFSLDAPKRIIVEELEPSLPLAVCELVADFAALYQPEHRLRLLAVDVALQLEDSLCTGLPDNISHENNLARSWEAYPDEIAAGAVGEDHEEGLMFVRHSPHPHPHHRGKLAGFVGIDLQHTANQIRRLWKEDHVVIAVGDVQVYVQYADYDYDIWAYVEGDYRFLCHLERCSWSWGVTIAHPPCACEQ